MKKTTNSIVPVEAMAQRLKALCDQFEKSCCDLAAMVEAGGKDQVFREIQTSMPVMPLSLLEKMLRVGRKEIGADSQDALFARMERMQFHRN